MPPDDRYPNPDLMLRHFVRNAAASAAAPDPPAAEPAVYELRDELQRLRAEVKALRGVVKAISRVAAPYASGNGR